MTTSRADLHCHSTASQVSKLGVQRALGLPECATPPRGGLRARQAPRHGLRDDHRSRHDRRRARARRPPRHVHLRGADRLVQGRAAGRPRALLRHHARRPRLAAGARARRRGGAPSTCTRTRSPARSRTRSTPSRRRSPPRHRRRLAELFPIWETRNGSRAMELNMPAAIYIETHGGTGVGGSRRPRRRRHRPHLHRDARARPRPRSSCAHPRAGEADRARRPRQRRQVGARRDGARHARGRARATAPPPTRARCSR